MTLPRNIKRNGAIAFKRFKMNLAVSKCDVGSFHFNPRKSAWHRKFWHRKFPPEILGALGGSGISTSTSAVTRTTSVYTGHTDALRVRLRIAKPSVNASATTVLRVTWRSAAIYSACF